ncbi:hypothetical protein IFM89_002783 [Coptis chinensis]|uniref:DUF382 domain-containing protein n=1 Tax=Coptis chinensis TaxID=261450 RepID=A0A835HVL9_9MAGN|nr:hypothetical protein IFM89_002783 [Coptis chinensis]
MGVQEDEEKKDDDSDEEEDGQEKEKKKEARGVSTKKKKLHRRMKTAELRPNVVEVWDGTVADPKLLIYLKSYRNSVPVSRHWSQKRKFLQGKRGIEAAFPTS